MGELNSQKQRQAHLVQEKRDINMFVPIAQSSAGKWHLALVLLSTARGPTAISGSTLH